MELIACSICGAEHDIGDMQIAFHKPDAYLAVPEAERERRCWGNGTDYFQIEECGEYRHFIRGWLPIPVIDRVAPFAWGVWAEIPRDDFFRYLELYFADATTEPPFCGYIATHIEGYPETLGVRADVKLRDANTRPLLTVTETTHPLYREQQNGIAAALVLEILHARLGSHRGDSA